MIDGCGFDCASIGEIKQVLSCGASPHRIIFANPCKAPEAVAYALISKPILSAFVCLCCPRRRSQPGLTGTNMHAERAGCFVSADGVATMTFDSESELLKIRKILDQQKEKDVQVVEVRAHCDD